MHHYMPESLGSAWPGRWCPRSSRAKAFYAGGWLVRPTQGDATWWHGGSLPGTTTILVRPYHHFSWVAPFNARSTAGNFDGELDAALWSALAQVTSFPTHDLLSTFR
jgi:N-acyl-D-amino-acid deacylase